MNTGGAFAIDFALVTTAIAAGVATHTWLSVAYVELGVLAGLAWAVVMATACTWLLAVRMSATVRRAGAVSRDELPQLLARRLEAQPKLTSAIGTLFLPRRTALGAATLAMHRAGLAGTYVPLRAGAVDSATGPAPVTTPFEPVALDAAAHAERPLVPGAAPPVRKPFLERLFPDESRRQDRIVALCINAWMLARSAYLAALELLALARGQQPAYGVLAMVFTCAGVVACLSLWRLFHPVEWYVVPGAIVVRVSHWRSRAWTLHCFPRERSVLVYFQDRNQMCIANEHGSFTRSVKPEQADAAIRAWLSPLPPPTVEQLSDLQ